MGHIVGAMAETRLTLWATLNYKFSPKLIDDTKTDFESFLNQEGITVDEAILNGRFYDFAIYLGAIPGDSSVVTASELGWNTFDPGTLEILSLVTFKNLDGGNYPGRLSTDNPSHKDQTSPIHTDGSAMTATVHPDALTKLYPRPMTFNRVYGSSEEVSIASTKYGLRVTITSMVPDDVDERTRTRFENGKDVGFAD